MIELTKDQKIQIINGRRGAVARNIFEFELDMIVMKAQGRTDDVTLVQQKIEEFKSADLELQKLIDSL